MTNWKKYKLIETLEIIKDGYNPSKNESVNYIGLEHIEQQSLRLCGVGNSSDVTSNKFIFKSGDILFGKLRPYFRKVYRPKFDGICSTDIWVVRAKKMFDQGFMFYFMANEDFIDLASQGSSGTRMPRADWNNLKNREWNLPDLPTQTRIASILSSLDDKIELNRRMNATLEQMAATLFKKYFVDDIDLDNLPKGWRCGKLSDIINIKHGYAFKGEFFNEIETKDLLLTPGNFKIGGGFNFNKFKYYNGPIPKEYILNEDDLIITMTDLSKEGDTLGYSALVPSISNKTLLHNQRIGKVIYVSNDECKYYLYWLLRSDEYRNFVLGGATGTTVKHTSPSRILDFKCLIPSSKILSNFSKQVEILYALEKMNIQNSNSLSQTRETLLPKLMSGEIKINATTNCSIEEFI